MRIRILSAATLIAAILISLVAFAQAPALAQQDYEALARAVIADLVAGRYDKVTVRYTEQMAQALPADKLAASWGSAIMQMGAFQSITAVEVQESAGNHIVFATCQFERLLLTLRLEFNSQGQFASFGSVPPGSRTPWKAPDYANTDSFEERAVTVHTGHWDLPGFVTIPKGGGVFPAIVLAHGSGPNDMDESFGPNKTFKDIAYGLASRGVAVLRYEKRTHKYRAQSSDDPNSLTVKEEEMDDARAAVALLATMPEINPRRIFVAGHSEGAYLAPRIATGDPQIAGIIMLAGNSRPLEVLIVEQVRYEASMNGPVTPEVQKMIDAAEATAKEMTNPDLKAGMTVNFLGVPLPAAYVLDLRAYHQTEVAAALKIPILILNGERDYQVTMADFNGWKKALAGHTNVTFKSYPAINHLFIPGTGPPSPVEYLKPGHVELDVIEDIAAWIQHAGMVAATK
ncbi:MAG: alpha/beta fold hydrolase [Candidatus Acidiferrales bacterium]